MRHLKLHSAPILCAILLLFLRSGSLRAEDVDRLSRESADAARPSVIREAGPPISSEPLTNKWILVPSKGSSATLLFGFGCRKRTQGTHAMTGNHGRLGTPSHGVYGYAGNGSAFAGYFDGNVYVNGNLDIWNDNQKILELGEGLDYAEGFNLTDSVTANPGMVLAIDPETNGKLTVCRKAYDTRVAGIVAGARGFKSGVRLGVDGFDCDVALAGRVYCNVDARDHGVEAGDLLTTSNTPGYAMKATDAHRSHGAILGKAMESLEKGRMDQILVLVALQ